MLNRRRFAAGTIAGAMATGPAVLRAQAAWPSRPVRLIVGYPAGGPIDRLARIISPALGEALGQGVVIENKGGGSGIIGMDATVKAPPDGYTFGMGSGGPTVVLPHLMKMPYDPNNIGSVSLMFTVPQVLAVGPKTSYRSFDELMQYARRNPGKLNFGSPGNAATPHLAGLLLSAQTGIKMTHIPYKGAAPAMTGLIGGEVDLIIADLPAVESFVAQGVRILAVLGPRRVEQLPDVASAPELGLVNLKCESYYGMVCPPDVPAPIVASMRRAILASLERPAVLAQIRAAGALATPSTPEQYTALRREEFARWGAVIKNENIRLDA